MTARLDYWKSVLTGDLRGFADRGTEPRFEDAENMLRVVWQVRGQQREAVFSLMPGNRLRWTPESGSATDMPYYAFLASESMAGFQPLASACIATIPSQVDFLASEAVLDDGLGTHATRLTPQALTDLIEEARRQAETASTQLFFLKGDAGAGKTTLLRETTVLQARRYLAGESEFLCLYVPAQGRELSNLRDAFAGELGDLRAAFTQDAIASLAREGILVPVIDGFDELLGTAGYGGAFSSLQAFLAELDGFGTLIVSARSAFYDIEFLRRSGSRGADGDMRIATAQIQPWSDQQLDEYLTRNREPDDADRTRAELAKLTAADRELLTRPFFASQFDSFLANPDRASGDLLEHLISAYIAREAGKIVDSNGDPVLTADGHCYLFELAVREMWESEVRQLSESDLKAIAELAAEEFHLDSDQTKLLVTKVTSYAGFRPRRGGHASQATFAFEHEVYFDHFLGRAMRRLMADSRLDELVSALDRGVISDGVARATVRGLAEERTLDRSLLRCAAGVAFDNRRRNLGSLALAYARDIRPLSDATIQRLSFVDLRSGPAELSDIRFDECQFTDVDLSAAVFTRCEAESSTFDGIRLDAASRVGIAGLHPGLNIRRVHHDPPGDVYDPVEISALLQRLGAPVERPALEQPQYSEHAQQLIQLLQRVARAYQRTGILHETDDKRYQAIFSSPHWDELRQLLTAHGVVSEEMREARGANVRGFRLRANYDELLAERASELPHSSTSSLWAELRAV
jgi:NACHT domain